MTTQFSDDYLKEKWPDAWYTMEVPKDPHNTTWRDKHLVALLHIPLSYFEMVRLMVAMTDHHEWWVIPARSTDDDLFDGLGPYEHPNDAALASRFQATDVRQQEDSDDNAT